MPANVSESVRAIVTAGFAKLVEDVSQYAPPMYAPTPMGTSAVRPDRTPPKITSSRPNVAMTSLNQRWGPHRTVDEISTAGSANITLATTAPATPPPICATPYASTSGPLMPPKRQSASVTTGFKWAPETGP